MGAVINGLIEIVEIGDADRSVGDVMRACIMLPGLSIFVVKPMSAEHLDNECTFQTRLAYIH